MKYIQPSPNPSGAYPAPQSNPFKGAIPLTENQAAYLVDRNGFVTVANTPDPEDEGSSVTLTENTAAWEAWKSEEAAKPEPEPTPEETTLELLADHEERLCMIEITTM